jgi:ParB/RepB/Spo0J family partition protein
MKTFPIDTVEYKEKIVDVPLNQIELNTLNPRKRFVDTEADVLIESIISKGLLNPIIVYKKSKENKYVILDGERRFKAFRKLNYKEIACHVLQREPSDLENLSMMFHLHNVREEWTDFAIAQTLVKVIYELGLDLKTLERQDKLEISKMTSLSEYKINKYLVFYDYPQSIIKKFMESEMKETPDKAMDPDILAEMHKPIKIIEQELPEFLRKYNKEKIIDACVKKKASGYIKTNRDFRALTKTLMAMKRGQVRKELIFEKLENFVQDLETTPQNIFEQTSQNAYIVIDILKKTDQIIEELQNLNIRQITRAERIQMQRNLKRISTLLREKLR